MKSKFTGTLFILSLLFFGGCGESSSEKKIRERIEQNRQEKDNYLSNIVSQFGIKYCWDSIYFEHSIDYQPVLNTQYQLINDFSISDIYSKNGSTYTFIKVGLFENIFFELECTQQQIDLLRNKNTYSDNLQNETLLIVSVSEIKKMNFPVTIEYYDDDFNSSTESDEEEGFKANGRLVDLVRF
jgi:hypothetical protein